MADLPYSAKDKFWNSPAFRSVFFQVLILSIILAAGWWLFSTTVHNLQSRGITSGFGFLRRAAGFEIDFSLIPFNSSDSNGRVFWVGLLNTLFVSILGIFFATVIGVTVGIARLSHNWIISKIATVYIETFRNIPLLLQIFFWYFAVLGALPQIRQAMKNGLFSDTVFLSNRGIIVPKPILESAFMWVWLALLVGIIASVFYRRYANKKQERTGVQYPLLPVSIGLMIGLPVIAFVATGLPISFDFPQIGRFNMQGGLTVIPEFLALLFALSIYTGSFIAEIVRAGINSVSHGQTEAAHSLAIKPSLTLRLIIIPQALRVIIPPLASQYLNLAKNSSLAAAIAYPELVSVFSGTVLNNVGQALECVALTMLAYLSISLSIAAFMNWYNKRMALVER
ncbi:MAG: amino acid ABC transporter permease [Gammaproteobacteria bacterium]|nr:MAG: amino acid ABC transporter permease [Gammaproteobacteria bacterium]